LDGHGSVVAAVASSGEVGSRSSYGPWGEVLEGAVAELGYLGGYGRLTDPTAGIVQMGARPYDPARGTFLTQDPVLGHAVAPMTLNPYPYVLDDPLGRYDLEGRDVCVPSPLGTICAEAAAEEAGHAIGSAAEGAAGVVTHTWEREWANDERNAGLATEVAAGAATVATRAWENGMRTNGEDLERAEEFVKEVRSPAQKIYEFAGEHSEGCSAGAAAGAPIGGAAGAPVFGVGAVPGAIGGGIVGCGGVVGIEILLEAGL
jgi:RHS repeat-associated protein